MTRFGIDALTAIRLAREQLTVPAEHQLVGPHLLRSQAMGLLYRDVRARAIDSTEARELLDRITGIRIRLFGDRVSRATAWRIAERLEWAEIADAEYVAVAQLQADALVTLDPQLERSVAGIVTTAPFSALTAT